jgi:hypothetical protein
MAERFFRNKKKRRSPRDPLVLALAGCSLLVAAALVWFDRPGEGMTKAERDLAAVTETPGVAPGAEGGAAADGGGAGVAGSARAIPRGLGADFIDRSGVRPLPQGSGRAGTEAAPTELGSPEDATTTAPEGAATTAPEGAATTADPGLSEPAAELPMAHVWLRGSEEASPGAPQPEPPAEEPQGSASGTTPDEEPGLTVAPANGEPEATLPTVTLPEETLPQESPAADTQAEEMPPQETLAEETPPQETSPQETPADIPARSFPLDADVAAEDTRDAVDAAAEDVLDDGGEAERAGEPQEAGWVGPIAAESEGVGRARLTSRVRNREPVDTLRSPVDMSRLDGGRVFYFTELTGMDGRVVEHQWRHEGRAMGALSFKIGSDRWRAYSAKTVRRPGRWEVVVLDDAGNVLGGARFVVQ